MSNFIPHETLKDWENLSPEQQIELDQLSRDHPFAYDKQQIDVFMDAYKRFKFNKARMIKTLEILDCVISNNIVKLPKRDITDKPIFK